MKNKDIIERTFLISWPYIIVFSITLYIVTTDFDIVLSFVLGAVSSLFINSLSYKIMKSTYEYKQDKIKILQIFVFIVKYIFMGLILYIAYQSEEYNEIYTLIGLLTFVIITVPTAIISSRREDKVDE
ncbi:MAG: ATP synthase subunit I [Candidatus Izimaplasma sp.]|nr:ATP synthase subunit I [Candidatus Izimaplasma bacterium]